jgi:hypothetical protein
MTELSQEKQSLCSWFNLCNVKKIDDNHKNHDIEARSFRMLDIDQINLPSISDRIICKYSLYVKLDYSSRLKLLEESLKTCNSLQSIGLILQNNLQSVNFK